MLPPRAFIFLGLNAARILSIVSLLLVFSSTIFVMVTDVKAVNSFDAAKHAVATDANVTTSDLMVDCDYIDGSTVPNQPAGEFWAILSHLLVIFQVIILLFSEVGWPAAFFDRYFPVLGPSFGLGALGIFQCLIGAQILSHHVDDFTLVAAFFLFSLGCLNMLLGLIFRERAKDKRSITTWRAEAKGVLPTSTDNRPVFVNASPAYVSNFMSGGNDNEKAREAAAWRSNSLNSNNSHAGYGFGRQGEKAAGLKGFLLTKPVESLPRYASPTPLAYPATRHAARTASTRSSTSSFSSPPPHTARVDDDDDEDDNIYYSPPSGSRSGTPVPTFKSSPTAL